MAARVHSLAKQWCDGGFALGGSDAREKEIENEGEWEGKRARPSSGRQRAAASGRP